MKFIDLFCGSGGFSYSFKKRNHELKLAVDIDPISIKTLKKNFPEIKNNFHTEDVKNLLKDKFYKKYINNIDLIMGGPPCQGFSNANRQNVLNDPRNNLYKYLQVRSRPGFF